MESPDTERKRTQQMAGRRCKSVTRQGNQTHGYNLRSRGAVPEEPLPERRTPRKPRARSLCAPKLKKKGSDQEEAAAEDRQPPIMFRRTMGPSGSSSAYGRHAREAQREVDAAGGEERMGTTAGARFAWLNDRTARPVWARTPVYDLPRKGILKKKLDPLRRVSSGSKKGIIQRKSLTRPVFLDYYKTPRPKIVPTYDVAVRLAYETRHLNLETTGSRVEQENDLGVEEEELDNLPRIRIAITPPFVNSPIPNLPVRRLLFDEPDPQIENQQPVQELEPIPIPLEPEIEIEPNRVELQIPEIMSKALKVVGLLILMLGILLGYVDFYYSSLPEPTLEPDFGNDLSKTRDRDDEINWRHSPVNGFQFYKEEELNKQEGKLLLVILGHVFDVSSNEKSYGQGTGYHGFVGRDGSRAFVTGDFSPEGLISDVRGLNHEDYEGLMGWLDFYFKTYTFKGYLVGHFFTETKERTIHYNDLLKSIEDSQEYRKAVKKVTDEFPPCNTAWSDADGITTFSCSKKSGGVKREWTGFVMKFKEGGQKGERCACIKDERLNDPRVKAYEGCPDKSTSCQFTNK